MGSCRRTCAFRQGPCRRLGGISIAPDPRVVELNDRFSAWVRVDMRLTDGCAVVAIAPRGKRKLGIYHKGPPRTIAEFANKWRDFRAKEPKAAQGYSGLDQATARRGLERGHAVARAEARALL